MAHLNGGRKCSTRRGRQRQGQRSDGRRRRQFCSRGRRSITSVTTSCCCLLLITSSLLPRTFVLIHAASSDSSSSSSGRRPDYNRRLDTPEDEDRRTLEDIRLPPWASVKEDRPYTSDYGLGPRAAAASSSTGFLPPPPQRRDDYDIYQDARDRPERSRPPTGEVPPIHYPFKRSSDEDQQQHTTSFADDNEERFASPRRDAVGQYISTPKGRALLTLHSGLVGMGLGGFIGKSLLNKPWVVAWAGAFLLVSLTYVRNAYGELSKALGLALIFSIQRTGAIRRTYPTWPHVKALLRSGPRQPFPPIHGMGVEDYWNYQPSQQYPNDPAFRMLYALIAMAFVGSFCGGNLPLIPTWMGALAGAAISAYATTHRDARGDLARAMGMRVVSLAEEVMAINGELRVIQKIGVVGGLILDKLLILDRKHRIRDRVFVAVQKGYDQASQTAQLMRAEMENRNNNNNNRDPTISREEESASRRPEAE